MYNIEFMILYLVEIIVAALVLIIAYLLIRLAIFTFGLIRKIIKKIIIHFKLKVRVKYVF